MNNDYIIVESASGVRENEKDKTVLLKNADAISRVPDDLAPGSKAFTADGEYFAVKDLDGSWKPW